MGSKCILMHLSAHAARFSKVGGVPNAADLMTKGVGQATVDNRTTKLNVHRACGRAGPSLTL